MCKVISVVNFKGGCGKTSAVLNLASAIARKGKKVLILDADSQGNVALSFGLKPDLIEKTLGQLMACVIDNNDFTEDITNYIIHKDNIDILPSNFRLSAIDTKLMNAFCREYVLKSIVDKLKDLYSYVFLDCPPSLGATVINALTASDSVLIPVEAHYLCYEGLKLMLDTIKTVQLKLNKQLKIEGIFFTMYQSRTSLCRGISDLVREQYDSEIRVFDEHIPFSIKAAEQPLYAKSIFEYAPKNPVAIGCKYLRKLKSN